jgi:rubrerythrin
MITKKDAGEYLTQMLNIELNMRKMYLGLSQKISDKNLKKIFLEISNEEEEHAKLVKDLKDFIESHWRS